ncbi:MAG: (Fe-S)-binding protein [Candidatus Hadarchaeales archaeon]
MKSGELLRELYHCLHCHLCNFADWHALDEWLPLCPSYSYFGFESFSASGKMEIARALLSGELKPSARTLQILFSDLGCGACHSQCHGLTGLKVDHVELFEELKAMLVERGYGPMPKQKSYAESIRKNHNPYGEKHEKRTAWLEKELPSQAKTVYFVGCTSSYRQKEIARNTIEILLRSGEEFALLGGEEWCCGSPLLRTGQRKLAKELAEHNLEALRKAGAKTVVFSCAGCYKTFSKDYPRLLGRELGMELLHTSQYFLRILSGRKLKGNGRKVTYHDPCHLGRGMGVYEPPRELLRLVSGSLIEMKRSRENSWCCGAGSGVKSAFPDFALWSASKRLEEAEKTGAEVLVSSCPFCKRNLEDAGRKRGGMEVKDLSELLAEALA